MQHAYRADQYMYIVRQLEVQTRAALRWAAPSLVSAGADMSGPGRFPLRSDSFLVTPRIVVTQGGRTLWSGQLPRLVPNRSAHMPSDWIRASTHRVPRS